MIDYVIYTLGTAGDVLPFVALAKALKTKNKKVLFLSNSRFAHLLEEAEIEFYSVSKEEEYKKTYENMLTWSNLHSEDHYNKFHFPAMAPTFRKIKELVKQGSKPCIIFQDSLSAARMACVELGLPYCQIILAPSAIYTELDPSFPFREQVPQSQWGKVIPDLRAKAIEKNHKKIVQPFVNPLRMELGLKPWTVADMPETEKSPLIIGLFPDWFRPRPKDWPEQVVTTGFIYSDIQSDENEAQVNEFIESNIEPIVFTFGTGIPITDHLVGRVKKVCELTGKAGILVSSGKNTELLSGEKVEVLIVKSANFSKLFRLASVIVHHGGIGTCAQAIAAGRPQLISPYAFDQPDNAYSVWKLGIGNAVDFYRGSVKQIVDSIKQLMESSEVKEACNKFKAKTCNGNAAEEAVEYILNVHKSGN